MAAHWRKTWDDDDGAAAGARRRTEREIYAEAEEPRSDDALAKTASDVAPACAPDPRERLLGDEIAELIRPAAARFCGDVRGCVRMWQGLDETEQSACHVATFRDVIVPGLPMRVTRIDAAHLADLVDL